MNKRFVIGAIGALLLSCGPTTYGQVVQQQKRAARTAQVQRAPAAPNANSPVAPECPTPAAAGSRDYAFCERTLRESTATGGSGTGR